MGPFSASTWLLAFLCVVLLKTCFPSMGPVWNTAPNYLKLAVKGEILFLDFFLAGINSSDFRRYTLSKSFFWETPHLIPHRGVRSEFFRNYIMLAIKAYIWKSQGSLDGCLTSLRLMYQLTFGLLDEINGAWPHKDLKVWDLQVNTKLLYQECMRSLVRSSLKLVVFAEIFLLTPL